MNCELSVKFPESDAFDIVGQATWVSAAAGGVSSLDRAADWCRAVAGGSHCYRMTEEGDLEPIMRRPVDERLPKDPAPPPAEQGAGEQKVAGKGAYA